jgi:hypothetical protein
LVSSLVVLVLMALLFAATGLPSGPAAVGLLFAFATPMFTMFGAMTEPHVLGLAPMTALALLWQRIRIGFEPSTWVLGSVAAIATLTSWQGGLFAASIAAALLLVPRRRWAAASVLTGTAVAATLVGLWILWAYHGDLRDFFDRALHRVGTGGVGQVTFRQMLRHQMGYFTDLYPVGRWLVVPAAALGVLDQRTRPLVVVSLVTVLGYALLFRNGAYDHNYWLYCILLPLSLSAVVAADAMARWLHRHSWLRAAPPVLGATLVVLLGVALWRPSKEHDQWRYAARIGAQARTLRWPAEQRYAYHAFGGSGPTDLLPWVLFYSRRQPFGVDGPQSVPRAHIVLRWFDGRLVAVPGQQALGP